MSPRAVWLPRPEDAETLARLLEAFDRLYSRLGYHLHAVGCEGR